ncbi:MAG TPA: amidohydrolase family protein [Vicinamibacterales bacterium]|nr:amidohydrolase family protein [Vicinamibacterales bacterium]
MIRICDAHCHFFSSTFFALLTQGQATSMEVTAKLGWEDPGLPEHLAERWVAELDRHGVARAVLIASIPGDEDSVAAAVGQHPARFVGSFMFNPAAADAPTRLTRALDTGAFRTVALFPAMHHYALDDRRVEQVFEEAGARGAAVFVHCGVLSVGVRRKLGLPSPFDLRLGDPITLARTAARYPQVPVIVPHFGAGLLREALMAADQCANIHLDTSSSNAWMRYHPRLTLAEVFRSALEVAGPDRVLFGTDSSFFPRGWQAAIRDAQLQALSAAGATDDQMEGIMSSNFDRLFPPVKE